MEPTEGTTRVLEAPERQAGRRLLLTYSDVTRASELSQLFAPAGFEVLTCPESVSLNGWLESVEPDLIVCLPPEPREAMLATCAAIREASDLPIVVLSPCSDERSVTEALRAGIDEYLVEPVGGPELVARIEAILRRVRRFGDGDLQQVGDVVLSPVEHAVEISGRKVLLSPMEYRLLSCLLAAPGKVLTHQTLMARVWGAEYVDSRHYLRLYVRYLREKLEEDPAHPQLILSEWGVGYRFQPPAGSRN